MIEFTANGLIEVTRDGAVLSRHLVEREALQSCAQHGPGHYVVHYPSVRVDVVGDEVTLETGIINGEARV